MADPSTKFTPKKRQTSCMQSSDDNGDTAVDDLCRKKFKPIAPKPFLKKDGHQSMLTTVLPVKSTPSSEGTEMKPPVENRSDSSNFSDVSSMSVMYGGPVFIPVRFPFPVLVPAMFNMNGNQQQSCTCPLESEKGKETEKSYLPNRPNDKHAASHAPCPVHYNYNSSQPTYINSPVPNLQSSFLSMYPPSSSSNSSSKTPNEWPGKPKYSRYKYSMLRNGDIYKGRASNLQNYQGASPTVGTYQVPSQCQLNQYSRPLSTYSDGSTQCKTSDTSGNCYPSLCPSECDSGCPVVPSSAKSKVDAGTQKEGYEMRMPYSTANKSVQVDAAVQTETQTTTEGNQRFDIQEESNRNIKIKHSSGVQCALEPPLSSQSNSSSLSQCFPCGSQSSHVSPGSQSQPGLLSQSEQTCLVHPGPHSAPSGHLPNASHKRLSPLIPPEHSHSVLQMQPLHVDTRPPTFQGAPILSHSSSNNSQSAVNASMAPIQGSSSVLPSEKSDTVRNYAQPISTVTSSTISVSGSDSFQPINSTVFSSPSSNRQYRDTAPNKRPAQDTASSPAQRPRFSLHSEASTDSEALQQKHYETDVIVPLRAAPSPSDSHDVEDMDRFVLSPVISDSDAEDMCTRESEDHASSHRRSGKDRSNIIMTAGQFGSQPLDQNQSAFLPTRYDHQSALFRPPSGFYPGGIQPYQPSPVMPGFHMNPGDLHAQGRYQPPSLYPSPALPQTATAFRTPDRLHYHPSESGRLFSSGNSSTQVPEHHKGLLSTYYPSVSSASQTGSSRENLSFSSHHDTSSLSQPGRSLETGGPSSSTSSALESTRAALSTPHTSGNASSGSRVEGPDHRLMRPTSFSNSSSSYGSPIRNTQEKSGPFDLRQQCESHVPSGKKPVQSVPLQSNVQISKRSSTENATSRSKSSSQTGGDHQVAGESFVEPSPMESSNLSEQRNTNLRSAGRSETELSSPRRTDVSYGRPGSSLSTPQESSMGHPPPNRIVSSSASGFPVPYGSPLMCGPSVPPLPLHESTAHFHGLPSRPLPGSSLGIHSSVQPHPHNPHSLPHSQHLFYPPHYGGLHQPLNVPSSPGSSHTDLLSPRSCAHLHFHNNMLHSPQLSSPVHNFQRSSGFSGSIHGSYPYPYMEERLETCYSGRCIHSPQKEDRSLPTLFSNILHRRPGAFSHLQQKMAEEARLRQASQNQPTVSSTSARATSNSASSSISTSKSSERSSSSGSSRGGSQVRNTPILPKPAASTASSAALATTVTSRSTPQSLSVPSISSTSSSSVCTTNQQVSTTLMTKSPSQSAPPAVSQAQQSQPSIVAASPMPTQTQAASQPVPVTTQNTPLSNQPPTPNTEPTTPMTEPPTPMSQPPTPSSQPSTPGSRAVGGNTSDKYLPVELVPPSPALSTISTVSVPEPSKPPTDQVVKYGDTVLKCSRQILRESGRTVLCCWNCDYHTAEPRKMHRHQKRENQPQKCQLCDFKDQTRCRVSQHYKEVHMNKDDPFRSVTV